MRYSALCVLTITFSLAISQPVGAQEPFSKIDLQLQATVNVNRNQFHEFWRQGRGGALSLSTPFYWGILEMGAVIHRYDAAADVPGFGVLWIFAGLSAEWKLLGPIKIQPGIRLGNYQMSFDDANTTYSGLATESDFTMSTGLALRINLTNSFALSVRADHVRVHTEPMLRFWYTSGGMSLTIPAGRRWRALWE